MLINLPLDVTMKFTGYLGMQDLYNWSFTCKNLFAAIHDNPMVIERKRQHFIQLFGTLATCEASLSLDTLINRIHKACQLTLSPGKSWMIKFTAQGVPKLEEVKEAVVVVPAFKETAVHLDAFCQDASSVLKDLSQQPIDQKHPILDYRNRVVRIKFMHKQIEKLRWVMTVMDSMEIFAGLSKNEKYKQLKDRLDELKKSALPEKVLSRVSFLMQLGATEIKVNDQVVPIKIVAKPINHSSELRISLFNGDEKQVGSLILYRRWQECRQNSNTLGIDYLENDNFIFAPPKVNSLELYISTVSVESLIDTKTGDRPLLRLLTQIAVEVFAREPAAKLTISASYDHSDVYAFMGVGNTDQSLRKEIETYRTQTGRWFPEPEDRGAVSLFMHKRFMHKRDFSAEHNTKYYKFLGSKSGYQPSRVEYNPDETLTWEKYIERQPVLNAFTGPLFWPKW